MTSSDGTRSQTAGRCHQRFQSYRSLQSKQEKICFISAQNVLSLCKINWQEKNLPLQRTNSYFEGLFVYVDVISSLDLLGLAEKDEVFKQEDMAKVFPPSTPDYELVLAAELTLFFKVHLERKHERSHA